jgi:hypothetical protein
MGDRRRSGRESPPPAQIDHLQSPDTYHDQRKFAAAPPFHPQIVQADRNRAERSESPQSAICDTIDEGICDSGPCDRFHGDIGGEWGDGQPLSALLRLSIHSFFIRQY